MEDKITPKKGTKLKTFIYVTLYPYKDDVARKVDKSFRI